MARQGTAKQAIDARNANATPPTPPTVNPMAETATTTPATPVVTPVVTPTVNPGTPVTAPPRVEGQWNYGSADAPVYAKQATPAPTTPPPATPAPTQPLTTEVGREQALGQLAKQPEAQTRQAEIKSVRENLKDDSGKQLWSNMEGISTTNANLLNNRRDFDEAFGYKAKDAGEKAMVDSFWRAKNKMDSKSLYNALETGETIPKESIKTPQFEDAVIRKQSVNKFENLTPFQLSKQLNTNLIPGTQAYNDLMAKNPKLVSDANKLSSINMSVTARQPAKTDYMEMLSNFFTQSQTMQQPATVAKIMNSDPSIGAKTTEVQALDGELNDAKMRLKNLQADVTERYKGTGASKSTIRAKALAESQDLIDEIAMIEANRSSASSALSTLIQNAKDDYTMARQDRQDAIESQQKQVANLMAFAKMGIEQDNEEYKRAFDQYKYDTDYLRSEASKDSDFAREMEKLDIQNQYLTERDDIGYQRDVQLAKMGYGQQERMAEMGYQQQERMGNIGFNQDIQKMMAQYDLNDEKDNKAFKQELIKTGKTPAEADALSRNASGNWNGANGKSLLYAEDGTFIKSTLSNTTNPYGGIECAEYVSRMLGTRVGSTFAEKKKLNNEEEGTIGSIAVWQPAKSGPLATYGHAGVIVGDDGQGNWLIKSANYKLDGRISTDKIPKSSIDGYRTTDIGKEMDSNQDIGQQTEEKSNLLYTASTITDPEKRKKFLDRNNLNESEFSQFQTGDYVATTQQKKSANSLMREIESLASMDWNDGVGAFDLGQWGQDARDARSKITTISSLATQPNLELLKGPMSDTDLKFVKAGSATLDPDQSNKAFESNIVTLYNISALKAGKQPISKLSDLNKKSNGQNAVQPTQGGATTPSPKDSRFGDLYNQL